MMSELSQEKTPKSTQEKEKMFLSLVDMFVDVVEPDIIQMILQSRSWDLNSAVEDIMIISNNFPNKNNDNLMKSNAIKNYRNPTNITSHSEKKVPNIKNSTVSMDKVNKQFGAKPKYQEMHKSTNLQTSEKRKSNCQTFLEQYNDIKGNSSAYERTLMLIREGVKLMVILRGPPGIGKSFLAKQILNQTCSDLPNYRRHIFSSDDFFISNNTYLFVPELLSEAHNWNQRNVSKAIKDQVSPIIVDNTNTQAWEMRVYADMAVSAGYDLEIVEPDRLGTIKESELARRNIHGVPKAKIRNMIDRYEKNITPHLLLMRFHLRYSLPNMPPQPTRTSKWKDKLSNHKNNKPKKKVIEGLEKPTVESNTYTNNNEKAKESLQFQNLDICPNSPSSSFQGESDQNNHYLHCNGISKQNHNSPGHSGKKYQTTANDLPRKNCPENCQSDFLSATKIFNDKDLNGYRVFDEGLSNPIQKNNLKVNLKNGDLLDFTTALKAEVSQSKSGNDFNPKSFDWMAETNKLLSAAGGSVSTSKEAQKETRGVDNSIEHSSLFEHKGVVHQDKSNIKMSVEKSNDVEIKHNRGEQLSLNIDTLGANKTVQGKPKWLHGMVTYEEEDTSWDYVLITHENTYIYQRTLSNTLPKRSSIKSVAFSETTSPGGSKGYESAEILPLSNTQEEQELNPVNETYIKTNESNTVIDIKTVPIVGTFINTEANPVELKQKGPEEIENNFPVDSDKEVVSEESQMFKINYLDEVAENIRNILENNVEKTVFNSSSNSFAENKDLNAISASQSWNTKNTNSNAMEEIEKLEASNPKPPRNLLRQAVGNIKPHEQETKESPDCFPTWDTVSNPLEHWLNKTETEVKEQKPSENSNILPQRIKLSNTLRDSSTNTNYLDFSLTTHLNPTGVKVLLGNPRSITDFVSTVKAEMPQTLLLEKSTMTGEEISDHNETTDITQISLLFPHIPKKCILEMVDRCQGNMDWAVDLLLDSEHSVYTENCEESDESSDDDEEEVQLIENSTASMTEPARCNSEEHDELKKMIESSVVFDKSHYSDQVLKVIKRKRPEYSIMIENNQSEERINPSESIEQDHIPDQNVVDSEEEIDDLSASSSECDTDNEKEYMELVVNNDILLQLQQKFGSSSLPRTKNITPLVKIPVSLARQLHGYIMDSFQSEMDQQQDIIEDAIMRDEEIAKLLQYDEEQCLEPQLQEIIDMEIALAMHKADQEELHENNENTVAARLSQNILFEKFPRVDCKVLVDMLKVHNYSLHDTIASLTLALDQPAQQGSSSQTLPQARAGLPVKDASEEADKKPESGDMLDEAQSHRDQAATYYSLRSECLKKAHEAIRSGNKAVATYYSQMAQIHKKKVDVCNSRAAACLLSSHKKGNTLDLHFLHVMEAEVVLDMFLDEIISDIGQQRRRHRTVFIITGRGLRSRGGVSRIKPMVLRKLQARKLQYNEVNPGMLSVSIQGNSTLSHNN